MKPEKNIPRRQFVKNTALVGEALSLPTVIPAQTFGANDRVNVAVLGVNGRGKNHIDGYMNLDNVQVTTTLVDPDMNICKERAKEYGEKYNTKMKPVQDQREVLDKKDIDVISIASCNHWHALSTIWACKAGKDVYVERVA